MITISYNGTINILIEAIQKANELLANESFYNEISKKPSFFFTTATGTQIAASLKKCSLTLNVVTFKKIWTRELGYEDPNDPTAIHINIAGRKLNRSLGSIAGTFIHEAVHAADSDDEELNYQHDGNLAAGNEDTAPYWIGNLTVEMIDNPDAPIDINDIAVVPHAPEDTV